MIKLMQHQKDGAEWCLATLRTYGLAYLSYAERTGKTLTALETVEASKAKNALVITTKKAMTDWIKTIEAYSKKEVAVINYHSVHKLDNKDYDVIILDEAHKNISMCGKVGQLWKTIKPLCKNKGIIFLSATPSAQSMGQLYNQLALSDFSPFKEFKNYFEWHRSGYGINKQVRTPYGFAMKWDEVNSDMVWESVKHLFQSVTRSEVGHTYEAEDVVHNVYLPTEIIALSELLKRDRIVDDIVAETGATLAIKLHQISGGTIKDINRIFHTSKIDYIKEHFGECENYAIFHQYIAEGELLSKHFPKCPLVGQITRFAEGVDLSHLDGIIVYSMNWSVATYSQSRNRCCNIKRDKPIKIHFILAKNTIDEKLYESVALKKLDFDWRIYATI
jgi:hypothetical protein